MGPKNHKFEHRWLKDDGATLGQAVDDRDKKEGLGSLSGRATRGKPTEAAQRAGAGPHRPDQPSNRGLIDTPAWFVCGTPIYKGRFARRALLRLDVVSFRVQNAYCGWVLCT